MSDLVEFLRARLAEDERIALAACYWRDYADCHPGGRPFKHDRWTRRYAAEDRLDNIVRTALPEEGQNLPGSSLDPIPDGWIKAHDLHSEDESGECGGCDVDGSEVEQPEWPCRTVETIASHHGIDLEWQP